MIAKGWRVVALGDDEGKRLAGLPAPEFVAAAEPLVGAMEPPGVVVRSWNNQALRPAEVTTASLPRRPSDRQLSARAYADTKPSPPMQTPMGTPYRIDRGWPTRPLDPAAPAEAPPNAGYVALHVNGPAIGIGRIDPKTEALASDGGPAIIGGGSTQPFPKKDGRWFLYAVPPGRWTITNYGSLSFCLGAPAFEVKAGEVVYAGAFETAGAHLGPDLALEPVQAYLGPVLGAKVRSAAYTNGWTLPCRSNAAAYVLELEGSIQRPQ